MSSVSTQVLDWNISESDGYTNSCTKRSTTYYWATCNTGLTQICSLTMPFAVSSCDVTVVSFETDKISCTNRTDEDYFDQDGTATINKPAGSTFTMTTNQVVVLANLSCDSYYDISDIKYRLQLYSGYLEYGLYCTKGTGSALTRARLTNIHLNVITRV